MNKIGILQCGMIILGSVGFMNHVMIIPILLEMSGRDSWAAAACSLVPFLLWIFFLYIFMKNSSHRPLFQWLTERCGNTVTWLLCFPVCVYLFASAFITIKDTVSWTTNSYLLHTPHYIIVIALILICGYAAKSGLQSIAISTGVLLPLVIILGYVVMIFNFPNKDYTRLFPLLEHGLLPLGKGIFYSLAGLVELSLVVLMQQHLQVKFRLWQIMLLGLLMVGLMIGPVTGSIAAFGVEEAGRQRYPAFEQWKLIRIGQYIEHVDFLSIYQWLAGAFIRTSLALFLLDDLIRQVFAGLSKVFLPVICVLLGLAVVLPLSDLRYFYLLETYYFPAALIGSILLIGLLNGLSLLRKEG